MTQPRSLREIHGHSVRGVGVDPETRCAHYHTPRDVIAIRFYCCGHWYPCIDCHHALADHPAEPWPADSRHEHAILCGACGHELTIREYLGCDSTCSACGAAFNPGCARHHHLYFSDPESST